MLINPSGLIAPTTYLELRVNTKNSWEKSYPKKLKNYTVDLKSLPKSVDRFLLEATRGYGDAVAFTLVQPDAMHVNLSFEDVDRLSSAFSAYLVEHENLTWGDVIALQLPNCLNYPIAVLGAWKAGLIVTNVNPLYTERELHTQLVDSDAKLLIACDLFVEKAESVVEDLGIKTISTSISDFFDSETGATIQEQVKAKASVKHRRFMDVLATGQKMQFKEGARHPVALYQYTGAQQERVKVP